MGYHLKVRIVKALTVQTLMLQKDRQHITCAFFILLYDEDAEFQVCAQSSSSSIIFTSIPDKLICSGCWQVKESHQSTKVDTSGTAKAVIASFQKLGLPFEMDEVSISVHSLVHTLEHFSGCIRLCAIQNYTI